MWNCDVKGKVSDKVVIKKEWSVFRVFFLHYFSSKVPLYSEPASINVSLMLYVFIQSYRTLHQQRKTEVSHREWVGGLVVTVSLWWLVQSQYQSRFSAVTLPTEHLTTNTNTISEKLTTAVTIP